MKINDSQRGLSWVFVAAIVLSICDAPWEKTVTLDIGEVTLEQKASSLLEPPAVGSGGGRIRLRTEVLLMEWLAASMIYAASFLALADKKRATQELELGKK